MPAKYPAYGGAATLMLAVTWTQMLIGTVLVALRAYAARTHSGKIRWDFVFVAVGTVFAIAAQVAMQVACLHGLGNHLAVVGFDNLWKVLYLTWVGLTIGLIGITGVKLSIVALLLSITPYTQPARRILLWTVGSLIVVINFVQIPISLTQCTSFLYLWNRSTPGSCPRSDMASKFGYFQGSVAITGDVFLALYPSTLVWSLQLSGRTKVAFCILMAGGIFPAVAAIIRNVYIKRLTNETDVTYTLFPFLLWATTEMWTVVILGSIPPLRPLFERVILRRLPHMSSASGIPASDANNYGVRTIGSHKAGAVERTTEVMVTVAEGDEDDGLSSSELNSFRAPSH